MSDDIVVITPEIAPGAGGVADYTLRVVEHWSGSVSVRFITSKDLRPPGRPAFGGKILLQYSSYGFDHFGYPRRLLRALRDWKHETAGRLVIMFHEIWTFWPVLNKNYLIQHLHRRDLGRLIAAADAVFTSTSSQAEHLRRLSPASTIEVLPVGSNITPVRENAAVREPGLAVLFGLQGSRIKALRAMRAELMSQRITKIVTAGGGNTPATNRAEAQLLGKHFEQRGALPEAGISELLARAEFGISAQDELSITKSGTFMAYAAHGLNILSPYAGPARTEPLCWATHPSELLGGIADEELKSRAENLRSWQERTCSWPRIAERFAIALQV